MLLDLHNHTYRSYDASARLGDYRRAFERGLFDAVAITDHNTIAGALELRDAGEFPVIVGEEVDTGDGELIGLFLEQPLTLGRSAVETARAIRDQGGLVYLQHPFYRFIRGVLRADTIAALLREELVDVVEGVNGGPFTGSANLRAQEFARRHGLALGGGSDAHHPRDIGRAGVSAADGPLTASSVLERLRAGQLVDRRRRSSAALADRCLYGLGNRLRRRPRKLRAP